MRHISSGEFGQLIEQHQRFLAEPRANTLDMMFVLQDAIVEGAVVRHVNLHGAIFRNVQFEAGDLSHTNLSAAKLIDVTFRKSTLNETNLSSSIFRGLTLDNTDALGATFANTGGESLRLVNGASINLVNFSEAQVTGLYMHQARAQRTNFTKAQLYDFKAIKSDLTGACLHSAQLPKATLFSSTLANADLREANLTATNFSYATLIGTQMDGADIRAIKLQNTNIHLTPSLLKHPDFTTEVPQLSAFDRSVMQRGLS